MEERNENKTWCAGVPDDLEKKSKAFLQGKNVVVFQHLKTGKRKIDTSSGKKEVDTIESLKRFIDEGDRCKREFEQSLEMDFNDALEKYKDAASHIKVIYLFLTEGYYGAMLGNLASGEYDRRIVQASEHLLPRITGTLFSSSPISVKLIGLEQLQEVMAGVQTHEKKGFRDYLLDSRGKGGYDTPKIAASLIKLARLDYEREEIIIQIDDDVRPNAIGLQNLKERYFELLHQGGNRKFCISWNYNNIRIEKGIDPLNGPDYDNLFRYLVNSFSIRVTFMAEPSVRCRISDSGQIDLLQADDQKANLDIIRTKYFLDLFRMGAWGSNLNDPISGAGMVYSSESLRELPPWTNSDEMVSWIDDYNKWLLMETYYGNNFRSDMGLLIRESGRGFPQERNDPSEFRIKDVKWSVNTYLDRLLMGCLLCFAVKPGLFHAHMKEGFGSLLREKDYSLAKMAWKDLREKLEHGMTEHALQILQDWLFCFCRQTVPGKPGYIEFPPRCPDGFAKAPPDTPFNAYTIMQLNCLKNGSFSLVRKVLKVLDRYLELKYEFWPQVVKRMERIKAEYKDKIARHAGDSVSNEWLFEGLSGIRDTPPVPTRRSVASYALVKWQDYQHNQKDKEGNKPDSDKDAGEQGQKECKDRWLVQWNAKWEKMNLISGHHDPDDPNELTCIIREVHEELFKSLDTDELIKMRNALGSKTDYDSSIGTGSGWIDPWIDSVHKKNTIQYVAFSGSAKEWTNYEMSVFEVKLKPSGKDNHPLKLFVDDPFYSATTRTSPKSVNEWVSEEDIEKGYTRIGRPISPTVKLLFDKMKSS